MCERSERFAEQCEAAPELAAVEDQHDDNDGLDHYAGHYVDHDWQHHYRLDNHTVIDDDNGIDYEYWLDHYYDGAPFWSVHRHIRESE
jgi:hypothetical protein